MGKIKINLAEKGLLEHLMKGGEPDDVDGVQYVAKFANVVFNDSSTGHILKRYGFDEARTARFYGGVIRELMPRPWMKVGNPLLVPTQWFMEPHRLEEILANYVETKPGVSVALADEFLVSEASELARATRAAHDEKYGQASVTVSDEGGVPFNSGGCVPLLLAGVLVVVLLGGAADLLLS